MSAPDRPTAARPLPAPGPAADLIHDPTPRLVLGLGGGCHWCTEAVFQHVRGVQDVEQGFWRADRPHHAWSEGVRLSLASQALPLSVLLEIHLRTHASTRAHSMRGKYRSAVYVEDAETHALVERTLADLQSGFDAPLVTQVLPARAFKLSEPRFRDYHRTDPERPFCQTYIDPKLAMLRREFAAVVRSEIKSASKRESEELGCASVHPVSHNRIV